MSEQTENPENYNNHLIGIYTANTKYIYRIQQHIFKYLVEKDFVISIGRIRNFVKTVIIPEAQAYNDCIFITRVNWAELLNDWNVQFEEYKQYNQKPGNQETKAVSRFNKTHPFHARMEAWEKEKETTCNQN